MKVYPPQAEIGDTEGFTAKNDLFGRATLGEGMTNLVTRIEDPMVIALDGPWGSGKSTFLRMWAGELRQAKFPVIVFDAFENDYVDDAFAALAREIIELSERSKSVPAAAVEDIKEKAIELGGMLLRGAGRIAVNVGVRAATAGLLSSSDLEGLGDQIESEVTGITDKYMEKLLAKPSEQKLTVNAFREALSALPAALADEADEPKPLIFIIDELDRCKPLFALSLLERIKHFMAVPNVHFVLGVHLRQLEASIKAVYGADIDANAYLQKFVNLTVQNVDRADRPEAGSLRKYADHLRKVLDIPIDNDSPLGTATTLIVRVIEQHGGGLRTLERAYTVLSIALAFTPTNQLRLGAIIGGLVMIKILHPALFGKAKAGLLTLEEARKALYLQPLGKNEDRNAEWQVEWWTYCLADTLPESLKDYGSNLARYAVDSNRAGLITYTANEIVDRLK